MTILDLDEARKREADKDYDKAEDGWKRTS